MLVKKLQDSYKDCKVLVTGHTGFKGTWLSMLLHSFGSRIAGFSLPLSEKNAFFKSTGLQSHIQQYEGDIRDEKVVSEMVSRVQPEIVFHLAAQPLVIESYKDPIGTFETNAIGTAKLLDVCRNFDSIKSIVVITTDKVYENKESNIAYSERDPLGGYDPYSASKAAAEIITASYRQSFYNHKVIATARAGNVIGGGDWAENRIIPDCIRALHNGDPVQVRNPHSIRPWQHVLEPLWGYISLGMRIRETQEGCDSWNFGPLQENQVRVIELVKSILSFWGSGSINCSETEKSAMHEAGILQLDIKKSFTHLGWKPVLNFDETVSRTVSEYKDLLTGKDTTDIMQKSITTYMEKVESVQLRLLQEEIV